MVDSPLIGTFIAQVAFWILLGVGAMDGALSIKRATGFIALWALGFIALPRITWWSSGFVTPWVAVLDIALVFVVFKGDVRLT